MELRQRVGLIAPSSALRVATGRPHWGLFGSSGLTSIFGIGFCGGASLGALRYGPAAPSSTPPRSKFRASLLPRREIPFETNIRRYRENRGLIGPSSGNRGCPSSHPFSLKLMVSIVFSLKLMVSIVFLEGPSRPWKGSKN